VSARVGGAVAACLVAVPLLVIAGVMGVASSMYGASSPSPAAVADIPAEYLALYQQAAATCPGLDWSVLAAVGKIETDHGRSPLPGVGSGENQAGAAGPMQFLAATFDAVTARHPLPPGGSHPPSRYDPHDAIFAAAHYLCDNGADTRGGSAGVRAALYAYNHSEHYVQDVLDTASGYRRDAVPDPAAAGAGCGDGHPIRATNTATLAAINYACGQRGLPYLWGGDGPDHGEAGFDCSGLTTAAYAAAGITLPRTARTQYLAGPHVPEGLPLLPGDLVFYGTAAMIHHVGLYLRDGQMINAPSYGRPVQVGPYRWTGDDYAGATRPTGPLP
jgi:cell wall-associated NlpC family hydrolase